MGIALGSELFDGGAQGIHDPSIHAFLCRANVPPCGGSISTAGNGSGLYSLSYGCSSAGGGVGRLL